MKLIKKLLLVILLVVGLGAGVYWANGQGYFENTPLASISWPENFPNIKIPSQVSEKISSENIDQEKFDKITQDAASQTQELTLKAQELGEHAQKVLGESVQENTDQPPIHEKVIEYGQYIYCKEVVKEWENKNSL
jgi:hypothetical protein